MGAEAFDDDVFESRYMYVHALDEDDDPHAVRVRACRRCRGVLVLESELDAHRRLHAVPR